MPKLLSRMKELFLFAAILLFVLLVNFPVISFDMMYPEQPIIYLANNMLPGMYGLFDAYLHPKLLHMAIPFFRPSGHFLIYKLLTPFLGWHSNKSFIVVNLIFLALTGYYLIKLYQLFFPSFKMGGYIAFAIFLMHPALSLSRLIVLHFEFAHVFFVVISLYCFVNFCQKNLISAHALRMPIQFSHLRYLVASIITFIIAVTFKETAVMLGPVLVFYFYIYFYKTPLSFFNNKQARQIFLLLAAITITLGIYLTLARPSLVHPLRSGVNTGAQFAAFADFLKMISGIKYSIASTRPLDVMLWRGIIFTPDSRIILASFVAVTVLGSFLLFFMRGAQEYRKSFFFLSVAFITFLVLPVAWALALPWHLNLSLLFLCLMMGFCFEYVSHFAFNQKVVAVICSIAAVLIGLNAIAVNQKNIERYLVDENNLALQLDRNAILNPPDIKNKLTADSVIVVEDSIVQDWYSLGSGLYPFYINNPVDIARLHQDLKSVFVKYQPVYNGTLFRLAYLMPYLREELYPFQIANMQKVPNEILYNWLQNYKNVFCLGYDEKANWHDRTGAFKKVLIKEKKRRSIEVNQYNIKNTIALNGNVIYSKRIPSPDASLCQYTCDQDKMCRGFTYVSVELNKQLISQCNFYNKINVKKEKFCVLCSGYIKL